MNRKFLITLMLAVTLAALPAFGANVMIKGNALSGISDIVKAATGNDLEISKHSLMLYERFQNSKGGVRFQPRIFSINEDGSLNKQYELSGYDVKKSLLGPTHDIVQKIGLAISDKKFQNDSTSDRRNIFLTTSGGTDGSSIYGVTSVTSRQDNDTVGIGNRSYSTTSDKSQVIIWGTGHLQIKGIDKDVFVYACTHEQDLTGELSFSFVTSDRSITGNVMQNIKVGNSDKFKAFSFGNGNRAAAIATGDIDNDGYKNEIVLCWNDNTDVKMYVYSVSSSDGKTLKINRIKYELVHTGMAQYSMTFSDQACPNVLVGDFDGDGRNEAAFVGRVFPGDWGNNDVRVGILKFNDEDKWEYETNYFRDSRAGPVKAAVADFDGDGKDEIALLYFPDAATIYMRLERWYCDQGSITPRRDESHAKGAMYDTSLLGYSFGGGYLNEYYAIAENFSITAGPLTGRLGKAKLIDDVAISHVDSSASRVFVVPTNLDSNGNFAGFKDTKKIYEYTSSNSYRRGALITGHFAEEILKLEKPYHTVSPEDLSFQSIIQAFPYHVDNVATDGKSLTAQPINYTFSDLRDEYGKMNAQYVTSNTNSESSSAKFTLESTTETIIGLDKLGSNIGIDNLGQYAHGYLKFHQMQANMAAEASDKAKPVAGILNTVMDLVTDKIEKTEDTVNKSANSSTVTDGEVAYTHDNIVTYSAPQHIWRYKILNNPIPSWFKMGDRVDQNDKYGTVNTANGSRYLTFSIYDDYKRANGDSLNIDEYQPTHEEGNFFSYPSALTDIEGYNSKGELLQTSESYAWNTGTKKFKELTFQKTIENTKQSTEKVTESELSKAISVVGSWFGNDNPLDLPPYTSSTSTFEKTYTTAEQIKIELQGAAGLSDNAAGHTLLFMPYVTKEGTMKFGTAVELSNNYQTLWRTGSIYNQFADPSLVLPMKFIRESGTTFKASTNHETATKLRGMRFYMPDMAVRTNNKLVKGVPYKIKVPVYNASFVNADNVEVRLSYIPAAKFKANIYEADKNAVTVIGTAKVSLKGWKNGSKDNKGWAEFNYTFPVNDKNLKSGNYEFYVEIDPENKIKEVHESRFEKSAANKVLDVGGNNEGHFPFELWGFDDTNPKTAKVSAASGGLVYSSAFDVQDIIDADKVRASYGTYDTTNTVAVHLTFDGDETTKTMYDKLKEHAKTSPDMPVPIDVEMRYEEDSSVKDAYPEVIFYAYHANFSDEALDELFEKFDTMTDEELDEYFKEREINRINNGFLRHNASLFPGETTKFTIHLRPSAVLLDDDHVPIFEVYIPALAPELNISSSDVEPEGRDWGDFQDVTSDDTTGDNISDDVMPLGTSSGGCDAGFSVLGLGILSAVLILSRKSKIR